MNPSRGGPGEDLTAKLDTVIIGAGQAGLSASYCLTQRGVDHVLLERGRVGETWRAERWDGFFLNTPNWSLQLPGHHYQGPEPDGFAPLAEVISYLESYARSFAAPIRSGVEVSRVQRGEDGFVVETGDGALEAHSVVVAAGSFRRPTPRPAAAQMPPRVFQLHTSEYRRPDQLPDGSVLIVGSGQSGCQIADELLSSGRTVYLSVGRCPWLPRRYRGREVVHWLIETGLADETVDRLPSPAARLTCNPPVSGNDGGHDCNPRWLARRGAILVGRVEAVDGPVVRLGSGLEESLAAGDAFGAGFRRRVDEYVRSTGLDVPDAEPEEAEVAVALVTELDLAASGVTTVIWASGFRPEHGWIDGLESDEQGWPRHERGVTAIPGLYFVGLNWLHKRKSALFFGVGEDAEHVASQITA